MPLAVGALVGWAAQRRLVLGVVLLSLQLVLIVPYIGPAHTSTELTDQIVDAFRSNAADGDIVVAHTAPHLAEWYLADTGAATVVPLSSTPTEFDVADTVAIKVGSKPWTGRVWLVESGIGTPPMAVPDGRPCAAPLTVDATWELRCYDFDPGRR